LATKKNAGGKAMNQTTYEKGIEEGIKRSIERGREIGRRSMLREVLEEKFGTLSAAVDERLEQVPPEELMSLGKAVMHAQSLAELGLEK
jgi:Domain of unknown function (DUF4351)